MTDQEDRDLLAQLLRPSAELSSTPDAADRLIRHGRRLVRRRRWATVSGGLALIVTVALIVGAAGLLRDASAGHTPTVTPVSPHVVSPVSGLVLGVDQQRRFILEDLAEPGRARSVEIGAGATGQVLTGAITANPGAGWVVAYAPARTPVQPATPTRLAIVDPSGAVHPFGPPVPAEISVGGLAVSPDGSRIALALISVSGAEPAAIQVLPMPGHTGQSRRWTIANRYDNDLNSLSWAPDSRRLTYITGTSTGAGMAGNPSTLDTSLPGSTAPATGASDSKQGCAVFSGAWLGTTGRFGAIVECPDSRTDRFVEMNPTTGVQQPTGPQLPIYGCNLHEIQSLADASRILINQCGSMYVLAGGHITKVTTGLVDAVWAGNITGDSTPISTPSVPVTAIPTTTPTSPGQGLPTTIRAVLEAPSPTQYDQPTCSPVPCGPGEPSPPRCLTGAR